MLTVRLPANVGVFGDSITDPGFGVSWDQAVNGFRTQMGAAAGAVSLTTGQIRGATPGTGSQGKTTVSGGRSTVLPTTTNAVTFRSYGIAGASTAILRANYSTVFGTAPLDLAVIQCGINDWGTSPIEADHLADVIWIRDQVRAQFGCQIIWVGALCGITGGEQWLTGPNRYSSGLSSSVYETNFATAMGEFPAWSEYVELRAWSLARNVALNVPQPGTIVGACTFDQVHPTQPTCAGMGTQVMTRITLTA